MAQRKSLLEEIREQNGGANLNQSVVDSSRKTYYTESQNQPTGAQRSQQGQRKSLLQEIIDADGIGSLNQDYVNKALNFDGGFGAIAGGYIQGDDGNVYMRDYSQNAEYWKQRRAQEGAATVPADTDTETGEKKSLWERIKGFFTRDRGKNILEAAGTGTAAGYTGAMRALYEAGQGGRDRENRELLAEWEQELERAQRDMEYYLEEAGGDTTDGDVVSQQYIIDDWQRKVDAMRLVVYGNVQQKATEATTELTQDLEAQTQKATEAAKAGTGKVGSFAVDAAINMLQMGGDAIAGLATGGNNLIPMAFRVFGQGTSEAQQAGADLAHQLGYGATTAGIEVFTEKLFDGVAGIYGKGSADEVTARLIRRMAKTPAGRTAARTILGMIEEGGEEVISDLLSPAAQMIYNGQSLGESYSENFNWEDVLYDFLVGAAVSGGMNAVNVANPLPGRGTVAQNRAENAQLSQVDEIERAYQQQGVTGRQADSLAWATQKTIEGETLGKREQAVYDNSPVAQQVTEEVRTARQSAAEKTTGRSYIQRVIDTLDAPESTAKVLMDGYEAGTASAEDYAHGIRDAYQLGKMGLTLEQAIQNAKQGALLNEAQFRHAWSLGAGIQTTEASTVDISTAEGREKLSASLGALGVHEEAAAKVYESGQDTTRYAAAMNKAAALYAANGADVQAIYQAAKNGESSDIISYLSPAQIEAAIEIGGQLRAENQAAVKASAARFTEIRKQADAVLAVEATNAQALKNVNAALAAALEYGQSEQDAFKAKVAELEKMVAEDPSAEQTEAYSKAYDEALEHRKHVEETLKGIEELETKKKELQEKQPTKRKKGTVSFEGGEIDGKTYEGVDREKLSRQQKKVVAMVEVLADAVNLDYVFFSGPAGMGGAYTRGGMVYININSGLGVKGFSQAIAAASLSHELTHYMQEFAPEEYQALKDFVIKEILKASPTELNRLVEQQRRWEKGKALSYDEALDEVVANACQTMLLNSEAVTKLARENMTLAEKVADYIEDFSAKIKAAFEEINTKEGAIFDAVRTVEGSLDEMQKLWDKGIEAATRNYNAAQTAGNTETAPESGVKYQKNGDAESASIKEQIQANSEKLNGMKPAATVRISDMPKGIQKQRQWIVNRLKNTGYAVQNREIGTIEFTPRQINTGLNYLDEPGEIAAFAALPALLKRGEIIDRHGKHKNRPRGSITIAAPVVINGVRGNMAVALTQTSKTHYHTHRIVMPDGSTFVFENENAGAKPAEDQSRGTHVSRPSLRRSEDRVAQIAEAVKENDAPAVAESMTQNQIWEGEEPEKTQYGFKLMNVDENGLPHAMFIDAAAPYQLGQWYTADAPGLSALMKVEPGYAYLVDADDNVDMESRRAIVRENGSIKGLPGKSLVNQATNEGKRWMTVTTDAKGKKAVATVGINGSGGVSAFALRQGIHAVDIPSMSHIGSKTKGSEKIDTRRPDQRWFLIEYPVDNDYNQEAYSNPRKDIRDHLPEKGWYSFQTNSGAEARQHWFITGGMKIVGAVSEADVRRYAQERGFEEDLPWKQGKSYSEEDAIDLEEYMRTTAAQPTPSKEEMRQRIEGERRTQHQEWDEMTPEEQQTEINATMTMDQAKAMVQKAFVAGGIREWYEGEYKNGDEWLKAVGSSEVSDYIENEYELQRKYINSNPHLVEYEYTIGDVLDAYLAGTLTGKVRKESPRVDVSKGRGYRDERFYAPQPGKADAETWELANRKASGKAGAEVNAARKNILLAAHTGNIEGMLGITASELNRKLRTWSRYPVSARTLSMRINAGVAPENQWTGIQNSAILNGMSVTDEDIRSMVRNISGESSEYQRGYIGNAMLALDTHIDWSWLSFDFKRGSANPERPSVRGFYENAKRTITIGGSSVQNTVSHEMGHALDFQWERDLFGNGREGFRVDSPLSQNSFVESLIPDEEGRIFYRNFRRFIDDLMDVSDNYSNYTMEPTEIFARFVAKFVEWTQDTAGAYTYKDSYLGFSDKFTTKNYMDFARLLQEKAAWDAKRTVESRTQLQRWDADEYEALTGGLSEQELYDVMRSKNEELREWRKQIKAMKTEEAGHIDRAVKDGDVDGYKKWLDESGLGELYMLEAQTDKEIKMLSDRYETVVNERLENEERQKIEKSGGDEAEYFGKQAVKEFGYTPYYYDAGYIVPNGKMLNFSGEKGRHFGSRGQDHRAIGTIFATTEGSEAMNRFINYGNIRIMAEAPGLDISAAHEPTAEQYRTIKGFVRESYDEGYFAVDFTGEGGRTVGTMEYDDERRISAERVVNDIKRFYQTGEVPEVGMRYQFQQWDEVKNDTAAWETMRDASISSPYRRTAYQQWDLLDEDTAAEKNGRELSYNRLAAENMIVADLVKTLNKQKTTIEKLQARLKLTKTQEVRESDARKLAARYLSENISTADRAEVAAELKALGDYFLQTEGITEEELKKRARNIATTILENAQETIDTDAELYREMRERIRGKKLTIRPEFLGELDVVGGFDSFRKQNFGKFTLARSDSENIDRSQYMSVDQFYTDIAAEYPGILPQPGEDGAKNEGDYIQILAQMYNAGEPMTVNPYDAYMGEATEELANQIVMDTMSGIMRPTAPTDADRAKNRREALQEQIKALEAEAKSSEKSEKDMVRTIYALTLALDRAESKYRSLRQEADIRTAQVREEGAARTAEVRARERERAAEKIQALKEHYQDMTKRARERREESAGVTKYRAQVIKKAGKLYEMLMKNDDKLHVPEVLKAPLAEFLSEIDFSSRRLLNGGEETRNDQAFGARLMRLQQLLSNQQDYINGSGEVQDDLGGYIDVSPDSLQFLKDTAELITKALTENRSYTINNMNAQQLKDLSNFLSSMSSAIRNMNHFMANARYESVREAADADIASMEELGRASAKDNSGLRWFTTWDNGTPYYVFKRFGDGGKAIFDGFTRGWEKMAFNAQEIIRFTENLYSSKEVNEWKSKIHEIVLSDGSKIQMTTAQIMELSMLLNREQALKHIEKGGVRIGDIKVRNGVIQDTAHYHLTFSDIMQITGLLTERQKTVAKALQNFMAVKGAEWGNEISMRRFGYNFYTEGENYYPIRTDSNDRPMADTDAQTNSMFRLLNLSSSKALNPKASNALVVGNIFDTFSDHMADMAKLNGMGLPILDAIKWFNYKERIDNEDGTYNTRTLQGAMQQAFGDRAQHYFRTLMKDINGMTESGDRGGTGIGKLMSNYKIAAVGANLRVALLQPTSYVRATTVIKPQYLLGILPSKAAYDRAMKYSGSAVWKSLGYYDTDISKGMRGQIQHDDTVKDTIAEKSMALAELGDQLTWSMLWVASERQAKANNPGLSGEELEHAAADIFREVVYSSQVMDSTLTRSEIMRGKTNWTKAASAFMAEPTLSYNILLDAFSKYQLDARRYGKAGAWQKNVGTFGKAFAVFASSAAFAAVMESLMDAVRDDDDDEFLDKFLEHFLGDGVLDSDAAFWDRAKALYGGNLAQDLTILGKLPFVKDLISMLQGYSNQNMMTAWFSEALDVVKILSGNGSKRITPWGKIYKVLQPISHLSGLAMSNFARDAVAIWNVTAGEINSNWKLKKYDSIAFSADMEASYEEYVKATGISKTEYKRILEAANTDGNTSVKQDELGAYLVAQLEAGSITEEQAQALWKSQWHAEKSKTFNKWRESNGAKVPDGEAETAAAAPAARTVTQVAFTPAAKTAPAASAGVTDFEGFKNAAPIYGNEKKQATYSVWQSSLQPSGMSLERFTQILSAADTDGNDSLKQDELGYALRSAINSGEMTFEQASAVWAAQGWSANHGFSWWSGKH